MPESKYIYIVYKTTNLVNGKFYIGVHKQDFFLPIIFDGYLGSGVHLKRAIKVYGKENFIRETLHVFYTSKEAYKKEKEIVNENFINRKDTYNICGGGYGGATRVGYKDTEEMKRKKSESMKQFHKDNPDFSKYLSLINTGKKHSEESKRKIRENNSSRNPKTKKKMSESARKRWSDPKEREKLSQERKGTKKSQEFKDAVSKTMTGVKKEIVICPHCGKEGGNNIMKRHHFDNCPLVKQKETVICPHCGKEGAKSASMKRYHFDNCHLRKLTIHEF